MEVQNYKIVYCTPALYSAGGVERVVSVKANYFAEHYGYDVTVIVTEGKGRSSFFPLSDKVKVVNLELGFEELWAASFLKKIFLYWGKQRRYKKQLTAELRRIRPDITITTLRREINFLTSINDGSKKIGEIHLNRSNFREMEGVSTSYVKRLFTRWWNVRLLHYVRRLDRFVVLTEFARREWAELDNVVVIPDPLAPTEEAMSRQNVKRVVTIGRYSYEKGYDMLLKIWSMLESQFPDWQLDIYAMGDKEPYERLLDTYGIDRRRCHLNGGVKDVLNEYVGSSIFVQPSRFEGFGLVVLEALSHGVPVVAFDCENGPRSIIAEGVDGFLIPQGDVVQFSQKLAMLMTDAGLRRRMAVQAVDKSRQYSLDKIAPKWQALFNDVMHPSHEV